MTLDKWLSLEKRHFQKSPELREDRFILVFVITIRAFCPVGTAHLNDPSPHTRCVQLWFVCSLAANGGSKERLKTF